MSLSLTLILIMLCFAIIWFYQGRDLWRRWQRFRAWELEELSGKQRQDHSTPILPEKLVVSSSDTKLLIPTNHLREHPGGIYRADGLPSFKYNMIPSGSVLPNAGIAMATPPSDLRISIAEMDRLYPDLSYLFPVGWSISETGPKLTACAFVGDVNHVLVTGFTDSGKDSLVNSWLYALCYRYNPRRLQLAIIDGKNGLSLRGWYEKEHVWLFSRHPYELEAALLSVRQERQRREKILWDARCEKWEEYEGEQIPLLLVYVSELLVLESILGKTGLGDWLNVELSACRAAGIRFIIGAQNVTRMDTRWRGQCGLLCAGYQQADSADEPNTGLTTQALRKLGTFGEKVVGVPPSELPIPPGGAGVFTLVQGRTVLTVRAPRIDRAQREWWLAHIPDRSEGQGLFPVANRAWEMPSFDRTSDNQQIVAQETEKLPVIALLKTVESPIQGYDPNELAELLANSKLKDLPDNPIFISACIAAYQIRKSYMGVAKDFWGTSSGSREAVIKQALGHNQPEVTRSELAPAA